MNGEDTVADRLAETFRAEWPRLVAAATRLLGDLQAAEDVVQDVLLGALDRWPLAGVPANPGGWLMTACRNRARNVLRDAGRARNRIHGLVPLLPTGIDDDTSEQPGIPDDRLRLVFICCHPVLPVDGRVALTLRMLGGLSAEEIARAWHQPTPTVAQRITRAKRTLAERNIPFEEPPADQWTARLPAVLDVIYLIFNEGYLAATGEHLTRHELCGEAHRLARLLTDLLPAHGQPWALRALIALQRSREAARVDAEGNLLTLEQQDRRLWDQALIAEGMDALARARTATADPAGANALILQAQLAAHHATAATFADTDWAAIVDCYDRLHALAPSPVLALNRAVALAMGLGPDHALPLLDELVQHPAMAASHRVWAVRADLYRRVGDHPRAVADYDQAIALVDNETERRHLNQMRDAAAAATVQKGPSGATDVS
ncbi:MAG: RNA polymerase sigma factor [Betaproteobacteria bacterium]